MNDKHSSKEASIVLGNLNFTVRFTPSGNLFLGVEDIPCTQQGVFGKQAMIAILRAVWNGAFDADPLTWESYEDDHIEWWATANFDKGPKMVLCKPDGYRLHVPVADFRRLVEFLKGLMENPSERGVLKQVATAIS